jgi:hypothetical protein
MIGGDDVVLSSNLTPQEAVRSLIVAAQRMWPKSVVEYCSDREGLVEALVYQDSAAKDSWDRDGVTEENDPKMLHLLASEGRATIVCGDREHKHAKEYLEWTMTIKHPSGVGFAFGVGK